MMNMMKNGVAAVVAVAVMITACAGGAREARGQTPYLVKDINTNGQRGLNPSYLTPAGNKVFFFADADGTGREVFVSDGTGALVVSEFASGMAGVTARGMAALDGGSVVAAGRVTGEATDFVATVNEGGATVIVTGLVAVTRVVGDGSGRAGFVETVSNSIARVYLTDGTSAGTRVAGELPRVDGVQIVSGRVYVTVSAGGAAYNLYSAALDAGTLEFVHNFPRSAPSGFVAFGGAVYFVGDEVIGGGRELWRTDGTSAGTAQAFNLFNSGSGVLSDPVVFNGALYFSGLRDLEEGAELFASDGTLAGTRLVADIAPAAFGSSNPGGFAVSGGVLAFSATTPATGREIFRSDGTASGTRLLWDAAAGAADGGTAVLGLSGPASRFVVRYPAAGTSANTLDAVDGETGATTRLNTGASSVTNTVQSAGRVFFAAIEVQRGNELFATDAASPATIVADLRTGGSESSSPFLLTASQGQLYFQANWEGWRSDGSATGTVKLPGRSPDARGFVSAGSTTVYTTTGVIAGTFLRELHAAADGAVLATDAARTLFSLNGVAVYARMQAMIGPAIGLGRTDGTVAGTAAITGAPANLDGRGGYLLGVINGKAVFVASSPTTGAEPFVYDGVSVTLLADLAPGSANAFGVEPTIPTQAVLNGRVLFLTSTSSFSTLFSSDGTPAGTFPLATLSGPSQNLAGATQVFVINGQAVRTTDGTVEGTSGPTTIPSLGGSSGNRATIGDRLIYASGSTLYALDVSLAAPQVLATGLTSIQNLRSVGDRAFFSADDGVHRHQLFVTDGTPAGTGFFAQLATSGSPFPGGFTRVGNKVFFSAGTNDLGAELWAVDISVPPLRCQPADIADDAGMPLQGQVRHDRQHRRQRGRLQRLLQLLLHDTIDRIPGGHRV
ncbi:hypothetical protein BH11PLA1_BH11PLA1_21600 [soil metagenome]